MSQFTETPMQPFSVSAYPTPQGVELSISATDASGTMTAVKWAVPSTLDDLARLFGYTALMTWFPQGTQLQLLKGSWTGSFYASLDTRQLDSLEPNPGSDTGTDSLKTFKEWWFSETVMPLVFVSSESSSTSSRRARKRFSFRRAKT